MCIILKKHKIHKFVQMTIEFLNSLQGLKVTLFHLSIDIKHFTCFLFYSGVQETGLAPFLIICNIADLRLSVGHVHTFISRQGKMTVSSGCFPHYVFQTSSHHQLKQQCFFNQKVWQFVFGLWQIPCLQPNF